MSAGEVGEAVGDSAWSVAQTLASYPGLVERRRAGDRYEYRKRRRGPAE